MKLQHKWKRDSLHLCAWGALMGPRRSLTTENEGPDIVREIGWDHEDEFKEENGGWI